jgi:hypothetical protein
MFKIKTPIQHKVALFQSVTNALEDYPQGIPLHSTEWQKIYTSFPSHSSDSEKVACAIYIESVWKKKEKHFHERVLHDMEREFIEPECLNFMNYCVNKKFITMIELEVILEQALSTRPLPLCSFDLEQNIAAYWYRNLMLKQRIPH